MCLSVSPDQLTPGGTATITYGPVSGAGSTVTVTINDGNYRSTTVTIELDDEGHGVGTWLVPSGWTMAVFTAPGCSAVTRYITSAMSGEGG